MKIAYGSDTHNEFYSKPPAIPVEEADLLVLAGDIETVKSHSNEWWEEIASHYKTVLYIRGNHEYYKSYYSQMPEMWFPENVIKVGRMPRLIEIEGVNFLAGTMWTNLSHAHSAFIAKGSLNDYRLIKHSRERHWFTPDDTTHEFMSFKSFLNENRPEIVVSHHLPSYGSVPPQFKDDRLNCAYATEMDIEGVKLWIHGHTHSPCDYMKQGCRVVCNPKGYPNEGRKESYRLQVIEYV